MANTASPLGDGGTALDSAQQPLPLSGPPGKFTRFAWLTLIYGVVVILFGAVVRITGSGAGCGQHWPTCHGEVAHLPRSTETFILLLAVGLAWFARRTFGPGHAVRRAAFAALTFTLVEALIGAVLVRFELVGKNTSTARALVMSLHLTNTSLLTASIALAAWFSRAGAPAGWQLGRAAKWLFGLGLAATLAVSVTGAVTALGDTVLPLPEGVDLAAQLATSRDLSAHFLTRARVFHPLVAVLAGAYLGYLAPALASRSGRRDAWALAWLLLALVFVQLGAGVLNVFLSAPGFMQVIHLGFATVLWIALVLLGACAGFGVPQRR
jgi:heme a synthase